MRTQSRGDRVARVLISALVWSILLGLPVTGEAQRYTFTKIADTTGSLFSVGGASINAGGTVTFKASLDAGGEGIFTGSGGPLTTIADTSGPFSFLGGASINAGGTVAFAASLDAGGGIFTGSGGPLTTIADSSGPFSDFFIPSSINAGGTVAFAASLDAGGSGIFTGSSGPLTTIADTSGPFEAVANPSINAAGTVAFSGFFDAGGEGIFTGSGGPLTTIADTSGPFSSFGLPSINAAGIVAFVATGTFLPPPGIGIFTGSGGPLTAIVDASGPFFTFNAVSINTRGTVAFWASLDAGGEGIFTGPVPAIDKVIATGDSLFGSTVMVIALFPDGLNDEGQIAFFARLADGTSGIYRADPLYYDDFNAGFISPAKWVNLEVVQEIRDGKLVSIHRAVGPPGFRGNLLDLRNPAAIQTFQADVRLNAYSPPPGGVSFVGVRGNYYNNGTAGPGAMGDVRAGFFIRGTSTGVDIRFIVFRCTSADCQTFDDVIPSTMVKSAALGEVHSLAIGWNGAVFTFTVDGVPTIVDPRPVQPIVNPVPNVPAKTLSAQLRIMGPGGTGFVAGDFDNVVVNGVPYDEFSGSLLDPARWTSLELVREVVGGRFVSKAAGAGTAGTNVRNRLRFVNQNAVTALRADVTVTAFQSANSFVQARLSSGFYNDGTSTGGIDATGDIEGQIRIFSSNGGPLTAAFFLSRCLEAPCERVATLLFDPLGPVNLGESQSLFIFWDGSVVTYGMGGDTRTFDPKPLAPVAKPPAEHFKDLRTAAFVEDTGGYAYIAATFDNVLVNQDAVVPPRLGPFLRETVTGDVTSAGVGLRGTGTGTINLTAIPAGATVQRALLYWATLGTDGNFTAPTLNGSPVSGTLIGRSDDSFWGAFQSFAYRADVTALVPGNGIYTVAGLPAASLAVNDSTGASLVVIYTLPGAPSRLVTINDGAVTLSGPRLQFYTTTLTGFVVADPPTDAKLTFVVGDGQTFTPEFAGLNATLLATNEFSGSDGAFWDTRTYDVSSAIAPGATSADAIISTGDDGLVWVAAILSVPTVAQLISEDFNGNVALSSGETIVLEDGVRMNGNIQGGASNTVAIGEGVTVSGNVEGVGQVVYASGAIQEGNLAVGTTTVREGAIVTIKGNVESNELIIEPGAQTTIEGNLEFSLSQLVMGPGASLTVKGNVTCPPGTSVSIHPSATVTILGNKGVDCLF